MDQEYLIFELVFNIKDKYSLPQILGISNILYFRFLSLVFYNPFVQVVSFNSIWSNLLYLTFFYFLRDFDTP